MTGLIAIDESGDLGPSGTRYFAMAAIVMLRTRDLKKAADMLPRGGIERKWNNTSPEKRRELLDALSGLKFKIVYTIVDKNNQEYGKPVYGKDLYINTLNQVISDAMEILPCRDVNVYVDKSNFIPVKKLNEIVHENATKYSVNPKKVNMIISEQNRCIQLVDFVVGACRANSEYNDDAINILQNKVSIARRR